MSNLGWFMRVLRAFARRELMVVTTYRASFFVRALSFVFAVVSLVFFSRFVGAGANPHLAPYGGSYLAFTLVGIVVAGLQQVGVSDLAQRIRMAQLMGTLEAELSTPAPAWIVLGTAPLYAMGGAAVRAVVYLLGAAALLDVGLERANLLSVAVGVPLILAAFWGLGLLGAATTMLVRRANPVALVLGTLSVFLSGVMYPVSVLPAWLRGFGALLPLTHALEVLRGALLLGAGPGALKSSLQALALFAVLLGALGSATFVFALRRARVDGSLTHY
ncbi:MAG TPA: ABC transporter permease [Polyangia bacterium]|nr:ABC transporter permease [Polyangia bacterium]